MGFLEDLFDFVGGLYDRMWPFSRRPWNEQPDWFKRGMEAVALVLATLLIFFILAYLLGFCSYSSGRPSGNSQPAQSEPAGVVTLHLVAYDRPPCTVTPLLNITVTPEVNQPTQSLEERAGDAYPGPCRWDIPFRQGTKLTWSLRGVASHGWGIPFTWIGESSASGTGTFCRGSFKIEQAKPQPTLQDTYCSITLTADTTFTVVYQTYAYGFNEGVPYLDTEVYPHCVPARHSPTFSPFPEPCQG